MDSHTSMKHQFVYVNWYTPTSLSLLCLYIKNIIHVVFERRKYITTYILIKKEILLRLIGIKVKLVDITISFFFFFGKLKLNQERESYFRWRS